MKSSVFPKRGGNFNKLQPNTAMATSIQNQGLSKYVTLISSDGFEFVVLRDAACISGAIKRMLDPQSQPSLFNFTPLFSAYSIQFANSKAT